MINPSSHHAPDDVLAALARKPHNAVLAVISETTGPSYRNVGAMMAFWADGARIGALSSGCIEDDLALHAAEVLATGATKAVRYGIGSPFMDMALPCGGGVEIVLFPQPSARTIERAMALRTARQAFLLTFDRRSGEIRALTETPKRSTDTLHVHIAPEVMVHIIGTGPETIALANLCHALHYSVTVASPELERIKPHLSPLIDATHMKHAELPHHWKVDARTAVVLLFHEHSWEPPILAHALASDTFYIGALGSLQTHQNRLKHLSELGVSGEAAARLRSPIGLIPSVRDPRSLAISVLSDIISIA